MDGVFVCTGTAGFAWCGTLVFSPCCHSISTNAGAGVGGGYMIGRYQRTLACENRTRGSSMQVDSSVIVLLCTIELKVVRGHILLILNVVLLCTQAVYPNTTDI